MTTDSPSTVGSVATRMSSIRPAAAAFSEMRPSCGLRRSAMSSFASTFRRVVTPGIIRFGIRCTSWSTPSTRKRTTSASSWGSKWMSRGAVLGGLEDDRVDEPHERRVGDAVLGLEVVCLLLFLRERRIVEGRACAEGLGCTDEPLDLDEDVLAGGDAELERVAGGEPQLVDPVDVARIGDRDLQVAVCERVRHRDDTLEHVQRYDLRRLVVDLDEREIDQRQTVPAGERARDPLARGDPFVDDRLGQRALPAARTDARQLVRRQEARGGDQVGNELGELVDREGTLDRIPGHGRNAGLGSDGPELWRRIEVVHIPRSRYRQELAPT